MIKTLRQVAIAEGFSYLTFALTMPLKYKWNIKLPNMIVGSIHGFLFVLFFALVFIAAYKYKWTLKKTGILLISSLIPFGTFYTEKHYLRHQD